MFTVVTFVNFKNVFLHHIRIEINVSSLSFKINFSSTSSYGVDVTSQPLNIFLFLLFAYLNNNTYIDSFQLSLQTIV